MLVFKAIIKILSNYSFCVDKIAISAFMVFYAVKFARNAIAYYNHKKKG